MKPGDLVEFKAGLFGVQPPHNLGIYLERVKRKGAFFVVLHTLRGKQEVKGENVTGRKLQARLSPDELEKGDLTPRLKQLIEEVTKGKVKDEARAEGATDRDLWQRVKDREGAPATPDELAAAFFETKTPSRPQVGEIRKILESCREPGVGYFEREPGREERWRPITRAEHVSFHREKDGLARLRNKLVLVEEVEDEETGYLRTVYKGVPIGEAQLDEEDRARLAFVADAMKDFVLHDRFTGKATLGASGKHTLDGFSLFPWLKFLALDWTGSERVSISSTFVELLVDLDLLGLDDAVELVARRKVLMHPNFAWETRDDTVRAADRATASVAAEGRVDLRARTCYTIDPPDARDHDDAVGVEWHENGDATLWVHIADVSHYVTPESTLDHDARKRATSVYLPTGVLPMLPPRLSNDLCSLEPQQDRYAMSVRMRFDADGKLLEEEAMESVIRVTENVPYPEALRRMEAEPDGEFARMRRLADKLDAHRRNLAIETSERRIRLTSDNVEHVEKMGTPATRLIETFMVAANEAVARILTKEKVPLLYRCHPLPDRASIARFNAQCETMEVPIRIEPPEPAEKPAAKQEMSLLDALKKGGKVDLLSGGFALQDEDDDAEAGADAEAPPQPALVGLAQLPPEEQEAWLTPFRRALVAVRDIQDPALQGLVFVKTLGTMGRAFYTPANLGHFGLGSVCYCHFTSPIRRYPDLVVHRQLRWLLRGKQGPMPHDNASLDILAAHTSEQGAAAEALERGVVDSAMVFASRDERWTGPQRALVNGITRGGAFMSMEGGLEARVATADIPGGPYSVDEFDSMLFVSSVERAEMSEEITAKNWRERVDPDSEEIKLVRIRLGDRATIAISGRDYVEGRVAAKLLE
ncbi:MAG TPA: ribonuclease R family protein [Candidatus Thermoplasmatota archaeon]|nr:ribonuclease R family protein [Candidatus Thermoplasmatota archaeon]